jgi:hypothetical protein
MVEENRTMTRSTSKNSDTETQNVTSAGWWTPQRTKLAGICGLVGGTGGLAIARLPIGSSGFGIAPNAIGMLYPVWYVLFAVALLAASARYTSGRYVVPLFDLSLVSYAGSVTILVIGNTVFEGLFIPLGFIAGMSYLAMRVLGCIYGISLWRQTDSSRLTTGLFIISLPAIVVFGVLTQLGLPDWLIFGATLYPAFIALGYDLWRTAANTSVREKEVVG